MDKKKSHLEPENLVRNLKNVALRFVFLGCVHVLICWLSGFSLVYYIPGIALVLFSVIVYLTENVVALLVLSIGAIFLFNPIFQAISSGFGRNYSLVEMFSLDIFTFFYRFTYVAILMLTTLQGILGIVTSSRLLRQIKRLRDE